MADKRIRVTFLGTGTSIGIPVIACNCPVCKSSNLHDKRFRSSALVELDGLRLVIDCGPDFRYQMLKNKVDNIDAILFTHEHRDHIAGIDDIRAFNYILNKAIDIYGTSQVMDSIRTEFPYIFSENPYFGAPQLNINITKGRPFLIGTTEINPIAVQHNKLQIYGYRIGDFTYITDANSISPSSIEKIKGTKVLVINALRNTKHISHFSLSEALRVIEQINPERAYLTHISHFLGLHDEVEAKLPANVKLAYDNLVIEL